MNGFMYRLACFFRGRYGIDKLFYGLCGAAVVVSAANLFIRSFALQLVVYALLLLAVLRSLSKNTEKRYAENQKFLSIFGSLSGKASLWSKKFKDRKTHVYVKCPVCKKTLRLPKVKGSHTVGCPNCSNKFNIKI